MAAPNNQRAITLAIQSLLTSEMASGRIQNVKAVGRSRENNLGNSYYPFVGIEAVSRKEDSRASYRRDSTIDYWITLIVRSTVSLEDAFDQRELLLDDGAGNGVEPILRDIKNYALGGLVIKGEIKKVDFFDSAQGDPNQSPTTYLAYALLTYETLQIISL